MSNSKNTGNPALLSSPIFSGRFVVSVFSAGVILGTGIGYGYQAAVSKTQPFLTGLENKYNSLHLGMSPTEARSLLGPGTEVSQSKSEIVIEWYSSNGYTITATFEGGDLVEKKLPER